MAESTIASPSVFFPRTMNLPSYLRVRRIRFKRQSQDPSFLFNSPCLGSSSPEDQPLSCPSRDNGSTSGTKEKCSLCCSDHLVLGDSKGSRRAFYGLPPELVQHIMVFVPFHVLVKVFMSFPKMHRPILQQMLDHSLALVVLTLEIRQQAGQGEIHPRPAFGGFGAMLANMIPQQSPGEAAVGELSTLDPLSAPDTVLQTQWRATSFDCDGLWIEFQLEEKLGLEMAQRRRLELEQQQQEYILHHQQSCPQRDSTKSHQDALDLHMTLPHHLPQRHLDDMENTIWRSRRRRVPNQRVAPDVATASSAPSSSSEVCDSNFFHLNESIAQPMLSSAKVSFKAHRNTPASWVPQALEHLGTSDPYTSFLDQSPCDGMSKSPQSSVESIRATSARERIAAYQQNRVLLRTLARMKSLTESRLVEFLPMALGLDARELGQKNLEVAMRVAGKPMSSKAGWSESEIEGPPTTQGAKGFSATLRGVFQRRASLDARRPELAVQEELGSKATLWTMAAAMRRSTKRPCSGAGSCPTRVMVMRTMTVHSPEQGLRANPSGGLKRKGSAMLLRLRRSQKERKHDSPDEIPSSDAETAERESEPQRPAADGRGFKEQECGVDAEARQDEKRGMKQKELFEFTYSVRHNYLDTRLEGERVIRPMRFGCALEVFAGDA